MKPTTSRYTKSSWRMDVNESIQGILGGVKECIQGVIKSKECIQGVIKAKECIQGVMKANECILRVMGGQVMYTRSNGRSRNIHQE